MSFVIKVPLPYDELLLLKIFKLGIRLSKLSEELDEKDRITVF